MLGSSDPRESIHGTSNQKSTPDGILKESAFPQTGMTLLAPDIVEAIMDGWQPAELGVHVLREGFPVEWGEQQRLFCDSILV